MRRLQYWLFAISFLLLAVGCARMGSPDGGWYDDDPPRVIGCSPEDKATNVTIKKITIYFDEFIRVFNHWGSIRGDKIETLTQTNH